jgi:hypothetical protein
MLLTAKVLFQLFIAVNKTITFFGPNDEINIQILTVLSRDLLLMQMAVMPFVK